MTDQWGCSAADGEELGLAPWPSLHQRWSYDKLTSLPNAKDYLKPGVSHHVFIAVDLVLFSFVVGTGFREEAGAVEVNIGVQVLLIEVVDERCPVLWDVAVTEQFSDHGAVFAFCQGIVVGVV